VTGDYCQGILALRISLDPSNSTSIWFATTHIGIGTEIQEAIQIPPAIQLLQPSLPVILTGDFNSFPSSSAIQYLTNGTSPFFLDVWTLCNQNQSDPGFTFNSSVPTERIDYQLYYQSKYFQSYKLECNQIQVGVSEASDHRPLIATYTVVYPSVSSQEEVKKQKEEEEQNEEH
jgi:endonuclease/exonuclease/phosphatase family metal-dependent hydrolase